MATVKISALPVDTNPILSSDILPLVTGGVTKSITGTLLGVAGWTNKSVLFSNASGNLSEDNASFNYDSVTKTLSSNIFSGNSVDLKGTVSGTVTLIPQSTAGTYSFIFPNSAGTTGQLLTSGGGAALTWTSIASISVSSIAGTANQISVSGSIGAVTISLPATIIAPGTITATTSVTSPLYDLTGSSSGTISIKPQAAAGTYNFNLPIDAGTSGYLLTSGGGAGAPMTWTNPGSVIGVSSITGTANQITASASTGAVTLSFPSTLIAPGTFAAVTSVSSPSFLLTGASSGTISILPQVIAGTYNFNLPTTSGSSGQFLASGGGGASPMTWVSISSVTVSSITGTANQIAASSSTGAVTLSLSNGVSIGSYQATTPPTGGMIMPGNLYVGATASVDTSTVMRVNKTGNNCYIDISGDVAQRQGIRLYDGTSSIIFYKPSSGSTLRIYNTIDTAEFYSNGGMVVGSSFVGGGAPINGFAVQGPTGIGVQTVPSGFQLYITPFTSNQSIIGINGTINGDGGSAQQIGIYMAPVYAPTNSLSNNLYNIYCNPTMIAASGKSIAEAYALWLNTDLSGNIGTITRFYGAYISTGGSAGTISNATSLFVGQPSAGTNKICAAFQGGVSIGSTYVNTPAATNGLIVEGIAGFGTASPVSTAQVTISTSLGDGIRVLGTQNTLNANNFVSGFHYGATVIPGDSNTAVGVNVVPIVQYATGTGANYAAGVRVSSIFTGMAGVVPDYFGFYYDGGTPPTGGGSVTRAYGGHFVVPATGTSRTALFATNVAIGASYAGTQPPTNGAIIQGIVGINTASPATTNVVTSRLHVASGSITIDWGSQLNLRSDAVGAEASGGYWIGYAAGALDSCINTAADAGTPRAVAFTTSSNSAITGTISNGVLIWPLSGGITVGTTYAGARNQPTAGGLIIEGQVGIGTTSPGGYMLDVVAPDTTSFVIGLGVNGAVRGTTGLITANNDTAGVFFAVTLKPSGTINYAMQQYIYPVVNASLATSTTVPVSAGLLIHDGTLQSGSVTMAYGVWITAPGFGTDRCALYTANLSVGFTGVTPPSSGAIISGSVGVGASSVNSAAILEITSTTKGVRFPNMTTTQKNAIANLAGNVVFDTTLGKLCVNSGSAWQTITSV